tara:strand:+ start:1093 stop:1272 length:180 start_codon:yes stop_codon:yes gene_type:complete
MRRTDGKHEGLLGLNRKIPLRLAQIDSKPPGVILKKRIVPDEFSRSYSSIKSRQKFLDD